MEFALQFEWKTGYLGTRLTSHKLNLILEATSYTRKSKRLFALCVCVCVCTVVFNFFSIPVFGNFLGLTFTCSCCIHPLTLVSYIIFLCLIFCFSLSVTTILTRAATTTTTTTATTHALLLYNTQLKNNQEKHKKIRLPSN